MGESSNQGVVVVSLELPWPPSVNAAYRTYRGRVILSAKGRAYKKEAEQLLSLLSGIGPGSELFEERLDVVCMMFPPDRRKRDLDNLNKLLLDSMEGYLFKNDAQIDRLCLERREVVKEGKVLVQVKEYVPDAFDLWMEPFIE